MRTDAGRWVPPGLLLAAAAAGCLMWLAEGWDMPWRNLGPFLPVYEPEVPVAQARAVLAAGLLSALAVCWGHGLAGWGLDLRGLGRAKGLAVCLLTGHVAVALLAFAAGAVGLLPWGLLVVLGGAVFAPGLWRYWKSESGAARPGARWPWWLAVPSVTIAFIAALAPAVESDGLRYHLFGIQEFLKQGSLAALPYNSFTNLPFQTNMLYMTAMPLGGARASQLLHWSYLPVVAVLCAALGRVVLRQLWAGQRRAEGPLEAGPWPALAGVMAVSAPVVLVLAAWPFVDLSTLAFTLAAVWALAPGSLRCRRDRVILAGLFAGAAVGTKLTAVVTGGMLGTIVVVGGVQRAASHVQAWERGKGSGWNWKTVLLDAVRFSLPAALVPMSWFVRNWIYHRNPVYPAGYGLFGGPEWDAATDAFYKGRLADKGVGHGLPGDLIRAPFEASWNWVAFEAHNPGPVLLALLPAALFALALLAKGRGRERRVLALMLGLLLFGSWAFWFLTYQSVRFGMLPLALVAVLGVAALGFAVQPTGRWLRRTAAGSVVALAIGGMAWHGAYTLFRAPSRPVAAGLGLIGEETVLASRFNAYTAVQWLNAEVEPGEKVFYIGEHRGLYADYPVILSDWFDRPRILVELEAADSNAALLENWRKRGIRYVLINYAELALYEDMFFKPRFPDALWPRYRALVERLLTGVVFRPRDGVFVVDLAAVDRQAE
ncbi:MAG: hypothetical protein RLY93_11475 [Sumerlaeia bacterium]